MAKEIDVQTTFKSTFALWTFSTITANAATALAEIRISFGLIDLSSVKTL